MALRDLDIKAEYRTKLADIAKAFLVPTLSESVSYKRAVGFSHRLRCLKLRKD